MFLFFKWRNIHNTNCLTPVETWTN